MRKILFLLLLNMPFLVNAQMVNQYCIMDIESKRVIAGSNMNERALTASICKVMTLIVAIENGNLDGYIKITEEDNNQIGSKVYIDTDDRLQLYDALYGLNLRSGNDLAHAISINVSGSVSDFVYLMNETAKRVGMKNTTFENPSGLDEDSKNYSTPYDLCLLVSYCYQNSVFREVFEAKSYSFRTLEQKAFLWQTKHRLVRDEGFLGGKTGYTKQAGRTLITTKDQDGKIFVCVTMNFGDDFNFHKNALNDSLNKYERTLVMTKQILRQTQIDIDYLPSLKEDIYLPLKKGEKIKTIVYLKAHPDDNCGYVALFIGDEEIYRKEIYVADDEQIATYIISNLYG